MIINMRQITMLFDKRRVQTHTHIVDAMSSWPFSSILLIITSSISCRIFGKKEKEE
jgi:hypothetical protein